MSIYINGKLDSTKTNIDNSRMLSKYSLIIGGTTPNCAVANFRDPFHGKLRDINYFTFSLNPNEIEEIYQQEKIGASKKNNHADYSIEVLTLIKVLLNSPISKYISSTKNFVLCLKCFLEIPERELHNICLQIFADLLPKLELSSFFEKNLFTSNILCKFETAFNKQEKQNNLKIFLDYLIYFSQGSYCYHQISQQLVELLRKMYQDQKWKDHLNQIFRYYLDNGETSQKIIVFQTLGGFIDFFQKGSKVIFVSESRKSTLLSQIENSSDNNLAVKILLEKTETLPEELLNVKISGLKILEKVPYVYEKFSFEDCYLQNVLDFSKKLFDKNHSPLGFSSVLKSLSHVIKSQEFEDLNDSVLMKNTDLLESVVKMACTLSELDSFLSLSQLESLIVDLQKTYLSKENEESEEMEDRTILNENQEKIFLKFCQTFPNQTPQYCKQVLIKNNFDLNKANNFLLDEIKNKKIGEYFSAAEGKYPKYFCEKSIQSSVALHNVTKWIEKNHQKLLNELPNEMEKESGEENFADRYLVIPQLKRAKNYNYGYQGLDYYQNYQKKPSQFVPLTTTNTSTIKTNPNFFSFSKKELESLLRTYETSISIFYSRSILLHLLNKFASKTDDPESVQSLLESLFNPKKSEDFNTSNLVLFLKLCLFRGEQELAPSDQTEKIFEKILKSLSQRSKKKLRPFFKKLSTNLMLDCKSQISFLSLPEYKNNMNANEILDTSIYSPNINYLEWLLSILIETDSLFQNQQELHKIFESFTFALKTSSMTIKNFLYTTITKVLKYLNSNGKTTHEFIKKLPVEKLVSMSNNRIFKERSAGNLSVSSLYLNSLMDLTTTIQLLNNNHKKSTNQKKTSTKTPPPIPFIEETLTTSSSICISWFALENSNLEYTLQLGSFKEKIPLGIHNTFFKEEEVVDNKKEEKINAQKIVELFSDDPSEKVEEPEIEEKKEKKEKFIEYLDPSVKQKIETDKTVDTSGQIIYWTTIYRGNKTSFTQENILPQSECYFRLKYTKAKEDSEWSETTFTSTHSAHPKLCTTKLKKHPDLHVDPETSLSVAKTQGGATWNCVMGDCILTSGSHYFEIFIEVKKKKKVLFLFLNTLFTI